MPDFSAPVRACIFGTSRWADGLTFISHTLGKLCLADKQRQAKYSEPGRARNTRIADIGTFS